MQYQYAASWFSWDCRSPDPSLRPSVGVEGPPRLPSAWSTPWLKCHKLDLFPLRRPLISKRVWSSLVHFETRQAVCGSNQRSVLHFLSCMSTVALSKHTNIAFVSVTDTVLPTPLNAPGVVSVIFLFYWNFLPHLLLNRNPKGNQLSPVNCCVHMTSPFPSLSISVFHHFKGFFTFTSFSICSYGKCHFPF